MNPIRAKVSARLAHQSRTLSVKSRLISSSVFRHVPSKETTTSTTTTTKQSPTPTQDPNRENSGRALPEPDYRPVRIQIKARPFVSANPVYLRDLCPCPQCVNPSTTQKTFQTTDIPNNIKPKFVEKQANGDIKVRWHRDVEGFGEDHVSTYSQDYLENCIFLGARLHDSGAHYHWRPWNKDQITQELEFIPYLDYMTHDKILYQALYNLRSYGLVIIRGVPEDEKAVEEIAERIGPIRNTFYGRTWDVKSVPDAKNVAYTHQYLGLHQDLLYMADPPGFQLLHCVKNSTEGGESLFSDGANAIKNLQEVDQEILTNSTMEFHYRNNDEHYRYEHPVLEMDSRGGTAAHPKVFKAINYSPPFQAPLMTDKNTKGGSFTEFLRALRTFAAIAEHKSSKLEFKLKEGDCVIFDNRRILHGRNAFDVSKGGERWLKGAYVDTDVLMSKWRTLNAKWVHRREEIGDGVKWTSQYKRRPSPRYRFAIMKGRVVCEPVNELLLPLLSSSENSSVGGEVEMDGRQDFKAVKRPFLEAAKAEEERVEEEEKNAERENAEEVSAEAEKVEEENVVGIEVSAEAEKVEEKVEEESVLGDEENAEAENTKAEAENAEDAKEKADDDNKPDIKI